jgi:hypothetical protein
MRQRGSVTRSAPTTAERADGMTGPGSRENRDFVRTLLARNQPEFARALASVEQELECRARHCPLARRPARRPCGSARRGISGLFA